MERFRGLLRDGDRVIYGRVTGFFDVKEGRDSGRFEVHQGGILGGALASDRPYRLDLDDGRNAAIRVTKIFASNSSGIATMEFRLVGALAASPGVPANSIA